MHLGKTVLKGWNWIKIDKKRIKEEIKGFRGPETFIISETIDKAIDILVTQFQNIIDLSTSKYKI